MEFSPLSQANLLVGVTDPELAAGVCVALCDIWLQAIRNNNDALAQRMQYMRNSGPRALTQQTLYNRERDQQGPVGARNTVARPLGHSFEEQTTVEQNPLNKTISVDELAGLMLNDLRAPLTGAGWTLRFKDRTGHALAGWQSLESRGGIHRGRFHLFDPNTGEFAGSATEFPDMVRDLFRRQPSYANLARVRRGTT